METCTPPVDDLVCTKSLRGHIIVKCTFRRESSQLHVSWDAMQCKLAIFGVEAIQAQICKTHQIQTAVGNQPRPPRTMATISRLCCRFKATHTPSQVPTDRFSREVDNPGHCTLFQLNDFPDDQPECPTISTRLHLERHDFKTHGIARGNLKIHAGFKAESTALSNTDAVLPNVTAKEAYRAPRTKRCYFQAQPFS